MNFDNYYRGDVPWLNDKTIFLTVHGSHAYGLATPTSDLDVKGVAVPPSRYFLGFLNRFEQAVGNDPVDLVIYGLHKFFKLAADANPNIIEVLYTDPQHHLRCTGAGLKLIQHREVFLSRKAKHTFSGYAMSQLKRIKTHRRWLLDPPGGPPTRLEFDLPDRPVIPADQLTAALSMIRGKLDNWEGLDLAGLDHADRVQVLGRVEGLLAEMKISTEEKFMAAGRTLGYDSNFLEAVEREKRYRGARNNWRAYQEWREKRNPARAELEAQHGYDCKHASHLVRLMRMCEEILKGKGVQVHREDREELLGIRRGAWSYDRLIEWAESMDAYLDGLYRVSTLPKVPDRKKLDELCQEITEEVMS